MKETVKKINRTRFFVETENVTKADINVMPKRDLGLLYGSIGRWLRLRHNIQETVAIVLILLALTYEIFGVCCAMTYGIFDKALWLQDTSHPFVIFMIIILAIAYLKVRATRRKNIAKMREIQNVAYEELLHYDDVINYDTIDIRDASYCLTLDKLFTDDFGVVGIKKNQADTILFRGTAQACNIWRKNRVPEAKAETTK